MPGVLADSVRAQIASTAGDIEAAARAIHDYAEIAFEEVRSSAELVARLRRHGFDVRTGVCEMPTAFVADRGGGGPRVAFVAEYDALRGLGHACGHNLIGSASVAAGIGLAAALAEHDTPGAVRVVGSPAEEDGAGKIALCAAGVFDDCDAALIIHPSDRTFSATYMLAMTHWRWAFHGRAAHAASDPEQGLNALDAFVQAYSGVALWRQSLRDGARVHGCILEGGTAPNVIPERTSGEFCTRARDASDLREMNVRFRAIFEAAAAATGCTLELDEDPMLLDLRANPMLAERCHEHLAAVGLDPGHAIPWDRAGSTDVGNLSYACPTLHPEYAIVQEGVSCHTHAFREAADAPRAYAALPRAAEALALTGADVVCDAGVRNAVRDAFAAEPWRRPEWCGSGA